MKILSGKSIILILPLLLCMVWINQQTGPFYLYPYNSSDTNVLTAHDQPFVATSSTITILIGGDIMLDRENRLIGETSGYDSLFTFIAPLFQSADISIANLEGPVTTFPSKTILNNGKTGSSLTFTFATTTATALKKAKITAVNLANNHSDNFGIEGIDQTHFWLQSVGVEWFGSPSNIWPFSTSTEADKIEASSTAKIICNKNICLAFVGYNEFQSGFEGILADVKRLSTMGYPVIVMPHWGDEYASTSPERIRIKATQLVSAGAFAIIGSHPHVIENREWIGNVPVIYSLGNLIFDQYFSEAVMNGNIAELTISAITQIKKQNGDSPAPPKEVHIDNLQLYNIKIVPHKGPIVYGPPIEFIKPKNI